MYIRRCTNYCRSTLNNDEKTSARKLRTVRRTSVPPVSSPETLDTPIIRHTPLIKLTHGRKYRVVVALSVCPHSTSQLMATSTIFANGDIPSVTEEQFFKIGEIRPPQQQDFDYFLQLADNHEGWTEKHTKNNVKVWMKDTPGSNVKMLKVICINKDRKGFKIISCKLPTLPSLSCLNALFHVF